MSRRYDCAAVEVAWKNARRMARNYVRGCSSAALNRCPWLTNRDARKAKNRSSRNSYFSGSLGMHRDDAARGAT